MKRRSLARPLLAMGDGLLLAGSFQFAYWLRFQWTFLPALPTPPFDLYFRFSLLIGTVGVVLLYMGGLYRLRRLSFTIEDWFHVVRSISLAAVLVVITSFVLRGYIAGQGFDTYSRLIILISWLVGVVAVTAWRWGVALFFGFWRRRGVGLKDVLIVGTDDVGRGFWRALRSSTDHEYRAVGFITIADSDSESIECTDELDGLSIVGDVDGLEEAIRRYSAEEIVLASSSVSEQRVARIVKVCERADVQFSMVPGYLDILTRQMRVHEVADVPVFQLEERIFQRWARLTKRAMDVTLSLLVIVAFLPVWLVVAAAIKLESPGSAIFAHVRVGKGERLFRTYKFRSMHVDAERRRGELEAAHRGQDAILRMPEDERVTRVGRLLRRFSIDEVPQVLNVLRGDMSWVGPRPHIPSEVAHYSEWHRRRFDVLPGISGLTQISGRKDLSLDEMVRRDIYYIENWTPWLDLQILLRTFPAVLGGKGAY
jgi:exopolysaccharide biosynthesis polyprenyl glycosylphosphotransferase